MFQRAISVYPNGCGFEHLGNDKFAMASFVGYKYGSYFKLGLLCERTKPEDYPQEGASEEQKMEVDESSQTQAAPQGGKRDLTQFNMIKFREMLTKQGNKDQNAQKLMKRNIRMNTFEQVVTDEGNIIHIVPDTGDSIVYRYRISEQ